MFSNRVQPSFFIMSKKVYRNLWTEFISKENFELAYKNAIKGKSKQRQIIEFKKHEKENLFKFK